MPITLIVAAAENNVIGRDGDLPWHLPADLRYFKQTTTGHVVIMGRRTWDSFEGALPGRRNVVLTRNGALELDGADTVSTLEDAMALAGDKDIFIAGGGELYRMAMPLADRILMTRVHMDVDGDTTFPAIDESEWQRTEAHAHDVDERHAAACTFETWMRR